MAHRPCKRSEAPGRPSLRASGPRIPSRRGGPRSPEPGNPCPPPGRDAVGRTETSVASSRSSQPPRPRRTPASPWRPWALRTGLILLTGCRKMPVHASMEDAVTTAESSCWRLLDGFEAGTSSWRLQDNQVKGRPQLNRKEAPLPLSPGGPDAVPVWHRKCPLPRGGAAPTAGYPGAIRERTKPWTASACVRRGTTASSGAPGSGASPLPTARCHREHPSPDRPALCLLRPHRDSRIRFPDCPGKGIGPRPPGPPVR